MAACRCTTIENELVYKSWHSRTKTEWEPKEKGPYTKDIFIFKTPSNAYLSTYIHIIHLSSAATIYKYIMVRFLRVWIIYTYMYCICIILCCSWTNSCNALWEKCRKYSFLCLYSKLGNIFFGIDKDGNGISGILIFKQQTKALHRNIWSWCHLV